MIQSLESSSRKRKRMPSLGVKLNQSADPETEKLEVQSLLQQQKELLEAQKIEKNHVLIRAEWNASALEAEVTKNSGSSLEIFGHSRNGHIYLYPEESLFLIEMAYSSYYKEPIRDFRKMNDLIDEPESKVEDEVFNKLQLFYNKIRLSVQRSYSVLLQPSCNISIQHYRIYKHFVIQGYKLFRHESLSVNSILMKAEEPKAESSYGEFLQKLQIFSPLTTDDFEGTNMPRISYDVFLPNSIIKKSSRPEPDYFLIILESTAKLWNLMHLVSCTDKTNLLFASAEGNSVSIFNLQGVKIPVLDCCSS